MVGARGFEPLTSSASRSATPRRHQAIGPEKPQIKAVASSLPIRRRASVGHTLGASGPIQLPRMLGASSRRCFIRRRRRPIQPSMSTLSKRPRSRAVLSRTGFALGLLTASWLCFAVVTAAYVPGHWDDVLRISSVCLVSGVISTVLIRVGHRA
jgi:hypothetical protein